MSERVGYKRVSTTEQNTGRQLEGVELDQVFEDKASGKDLKRPQFEAMLRHLRKGDTLLVHSMDRLARNLGDLLKTVEQLTTMGVTVQFVKESLKFSPEGSDPMANLMLGLLGSVYQFERALIHERQLEGIAIAKQQGAYKGRKRVLQDPQAEEIGKRLDAGEKVAKIAKELGVTRQTIYRSVERVRA